MLELSSEDRLSLGGHVYLSASHETSHVGVQAQGLQTPGKPGKDFHKS